MNEVYTGGIGSYAITLLAVSLFQMHPRVLSGGLQLTKNLGILLIEFFELYGKRFNYDNVCISVLENGRYLDKRRKGFFNMAQSYLLSIEDPCDTSNDVSKGTYGILRIKQTFGGAYDLINNAIFAYHQTRKHGEPINDTLRATAAAAVPGSGSGGQSRRKRIKAMDGNAKRAPMHGSGLFSDDPNAHVSFLSSILSVSPSVLRSRERLVREFYKGSMQKALGVQYQPSLASLLPPPDESDDVVEAEEPSTEKEVSAQDRIATMHFDFEKPGGGSAVDVITISDGE
ncbi:hypothetical protein GGI23_004972 [Coemansia sp. RSA 2559]|nr:hypothetical protein GGI23_004972 [Coemansia sp. RSA 2559]